MDFNPAYHHTEEQLRQELLLINAAKEEPEQFAPLYEKYYKQIFNYLYQRMDSRDLAFDLTAQVFLKALSNIRHYEYRGVPFASWLYRIAHNEMMQAFREEKNRRVINADINDLRFICEENQEAFYEEYIPVLKKLISQLSEADLQMVEMRYFERRAFKEIADILNITEVNAKVRMYRIIEKLKRSIGKIRV
ncbi:MAG TPA: sigma-70 family RNA polymerase sigma factor [Bacteroidia bacterium]|nr:sigma-70 family RNA polymerase sigma factor [Bacteroidia bacterium]